MKRLVILMLFALVLALSGSANAAVAAFSYGDFSGTQGEKGWYYGYCAASNGFIGYDFSNFTQFASFNGTAWSNASGAFINNIEGNSGWASPVWNLTVRRWKVSTSGIANISGNWMKPMSGGDGVIVGVFYNGVRKGSIASPADGSSTPWAKYSIAPFSVEAGENYIDFVILPRTDTGFDNINLDATIDITAPVHKTVNVKDYGAKGDGATDDRAAIHAAIDAAQALVDADTSRATFVQITFPNGTYALKTAESACFFQLNNKSNITLYGESAGGVTFLGKLPEKGFFAMKFCESMTFTNLTFDYDPLPFTQGVVTSVNVAGNTFDWKLDAGYPDPTGSFFNNPEYRFYDANGKIDLKNALRGITFQNGSNGVVSLGNGNYRSTIDPNFTGLGGLQTVTVGERVSYEARYNTGVWVTESCKYISIFNDTVYTGPGTFVLEVLCDATYVDHCNVIPKPGTNRLQSTTADGFHSAGARIGPWVKNSVFEGMGDDSLNIRGMLAPVFSVPAANQIVAAETIWNLPTHYWQEGDMLDVHRKSDGAYAGSGRITRLVATTQNGVFAWQATLDASLNAAITGSGQPLVVSNANLCGNGYQVIDNVSRNHRASFIQTRSQSGGGYNLTARIQGNKVEHTEGGIVAGIAFGYDEGPSVKDLVITGNTFTDLGHIIRSAVYIGDDMGVGTNNASITFTGNTITECEQPALYVTNGHNVTATGNTVKPTLARQSAPGYGMDSEFQVGPYTSNIDCSSNTLLPADN